MCWFARVRVIRVADKRLAAELRAPAGTSGDLPDLWVGEQCACDLVNDQGRSVSVIPDVVEQLLAQPAVKRVEVLWWWAEGDRDDDEPDHPAERRVEVREFRSLARGSVATSTVYRVGDATRWVRPRNGPVTS